ncbi:MAG: DUF3999 domain-containing protein [Desulforhopalus sp.]|nr:DUF3999 domain-containing protein [Desulforhopalus sp.]
MIPLLALQAAFAGTQEVRPDDFAAGYYLEVTSPGPLYSLELPLDVYRTVRRPDLGDIRVFNGAGEVVPHSLRDVAVPPEAVRKKASVPFFPLFENTANPGQSDLAMQVVRNSSGTIVSINADPKPGAGGPQTTSYLLDLSGLKTPVGELDVHWIAGQGSPVYAVTVQHSSDLQRWIPLVANAPLADLQHGGARVEKRNIILPYGPQKYLRLTWQGGTPLVLNRVDAVSPIVPSRQPRQWDDLGSGVVDTGEKVPALNYKTSLRLPVSSAQMVFFDKNPTARIALQSRPTDKDPWHTRCEQVFYKLSFTASEVRNEPCVFQPTTDTLWRAVVREDGAGIGSRQQIPTLQLGWNPSELVFIGRGEPPFLLAFGSAGLEQQDRGDSTVVLQALNAGPANQGIGSARLGSRRELGGERALKSLPPPPPWKKWLLWGVLVAGVACLAGMARSLIKEMNKKAINQTTSEK